MSLINDSRKRNQEQISFRNATNEVKRTKGKMQSSSRIPRRVSGEGDSVSSNTDVKKGKQETPQKISLTGQGKAAKLLRQRLAFALATNTKLKSDSSNSESDPETTGKGSKTQEGRKTSIPRKISQETTKKTTEQQHLLGEKNNEGNIPDASERSRKFGTTQSFLRNGIDNIEQGKISTADLPRQKRPTRLSNFSSDINNEVLTNNNTAVTLSRDPPSFNESLPNIHEIATKKSEGITSLEHGNFDVIERELSKLKVEMYKTLEDFQEINAVTEGVKMKLEELRRDRIRSAS